MISVVVLTKNEERNIEKCLLSLAWCDEVIVLDDNSTDNTVVLAKKLGAKVKSKELVNFATQRNYGLEVAESKWVLFIDADEVVSEQLKQEILQSIESPNKNSAFSLKRKDTLWGKKIRYGDARNFRTIRLAKKGTGKWKGAVHEVWEVKGGVRDLHEPLLHFPHQSIAEFLREINNYSTLRAQELHENGARSSVLAIILYTKSKFLDNYMLKLGFLDGVQGLVRALMMSYYSFLVRAKLWTIQQKKS